MYAEGAYWLCKPPTRSRARVAVSSGSSRRWGARSARFSSRMDSTRSVARYQAPQSGPWNSLLCLWTSRNVDPLSAVPGARHYRFDDCQHPGRFCECRVLRRLRRGFILLAHLTDALIDETE